MSKKIRNAIIICILLIIVIVALIIFFKFSDTNLKNLYDNIDYAPEGFVDDKISSYEGLDSSLNSASSFYEAIGDLSDKEGNKELEEETKYYYAINQSYVIEKNKGDAKTFNYIYIYFKNSIINIENEEINVKVINNKEKIKEIFNMIYYIDNCENGSFKIADSKVNEYLDKYVYTIYYFETSYGDWGLNDSIRFMKQKVEIDKKSGQFEYDDEIILKEFEGKYNSDPIEFYY